LNEIFNTFPIPSKCPYCKKTFSQPIAILPENMIEKVGNMPQAIKLAESMLTPKINKKCDKKYREEYDEKNERERQQLTNEWNTLHREQDVFENNKDNIYRDADQRAEKRHQSEIKQLERSKKLYEIKQERADATKEKYDKKMLNHDRNLHRQSNILANQMVKARLPKIRQGCTSRNQGRVVENLSWFALRKVYNQNEFFPLKDPNDWVAYVGYARRKITDVHIVEVKAVDDLNRLPRLSGTQLQLRDAFLEDRIGFRAYAIHQHTGRVKIIEKFD
jgi:predicted Holliday junction resolvase-like endonuclease